MSTPYASLFAAAAQQYGTGIPQFRSVLTAVAAHESSFNPNAVSQTGDVGIMQIHLASHPTVGQNQALNPSFAIPWGAAYLAGLYKDAGDWCGALEMYNSGRATGDGTYARAVLALAPQYGYTGSTACGGTSATSAATTTSTTAKKTAGGGSVNTTKWARIGLFALAGLIFVIILIRL